MSDKNDIEVLESKKSSKKRAMKTDFPEKLKNALVEYLNFHIGADKKENLVDSSKNSDKPTNRLKEILIRYIRIKANFYEENIQNDFNKFLSVLTSDMDVRGMIINANTKKSTVYKFLKANSKQSLAGLLLMGSLESRVMEEDMLGMMQAHHKLESSRLTLIVREAFNSGDLTTDDVIAIPDKLLEKNAEKAEKLMPRKQNEKEELGIEKILSKYSRRLIKMTFANLPEDVKFLAKRVSAGLDVILGARERMIENSLRSHIFELANNDETLIEKAYKSLPRKFRKKAVRPACSLATIISFLPKQLDEESNEKSNSNIENKTNKVKSDKDKLSDLPAKLVQIPYMHSTAKKIIDLFSSLLHVAPSAKKAKKFIKYGRIVTQNYSDICRVGEANKSGSRSITYLTEKGEESLTNEPTKSELERANEFAENTYYFNKALNDLVGAGRNYLIGSLFSTGTLFSVKIASRHKVTKLLSEVIHKNAQAYRQRSLHFLSQKEKNNQVIEYNGKRYIKAQLADTYLPTTIVDQKKRSIILEVVNAEEGIFLRRVNNNEIVKYLLDNNKNIKTYPVVCYSPGGKYSDDYFPVKSLISYSRQMVELGLGNVILRLKDEHTKKYKAKDPKIEEWARIEEVVKKPFIFRAQLYYDYLMQGKDLSVLLKLKQQELANAKINSRAEVINLLLEIKTIRDVIDIREKAVEKEKVPEDQKMFLRTLYEIGRETKQAKKVFKKLDKVDLGGNPPSKIDGDILPNEHASNEMTVDLYVFLTYVAINREFRSRITTFLKPQETEALDFALGRLRKIVFSNNGGAIENYKRLYKILSSSKTLNSSMGRMLGKVRLTEYRKNFRDNGKSLMAFAKGNKLYDPVSGFLNAVERDACLFDLCSSLERLTKARVGKNAIVVSKVKEGSKEEVSRKNDGAVNRLLNKLHLSLQSLCANIKRRKLHTVEKYKMLVEILTSKFEVISIAELGGSFTKTPYQLANKSRCSDLLVDINLLKVYLAANKVNGYNLAKRIAKLWKVVPCKNDADKLNYLRNRIDNEKVKLSFRSGLSEISNKKFHSALAKLIASHDEQRKNPVSKGQETVPSSETTVTSSSNSRSGSKVPSPERSDDKEKVLSNHLVKALKKSTENKTDVERIGEPASEKRKLSYSLSASS